MNRQQFVRCELTDGRVLLGGIVTIGPEQFGISQGILGGEQIRYSSLKSAPTRSLAPAEHTENVLKWTGFVAVCVAASPLLIVIIPLMFAGVIQD